VKEVLRRYPALHRTAAYGYHSVLDLADFAMRRDQDLPPRRLRFIGNGDFRQVGADFVAHAADLAGLRPGDRVLDVGCGIGRIAIPLTGYLDDDGSYEGFDVVPRGIEWCRRHITPAHPNFRFQLADIRNDEYNPGGRQRPEDYRFPYDDNEFDVAILTSVFTHLLPSTVRRYVAELERVLKPGGRCLATYFLLSDETRRLAAEGAALSEFPYEGDGYATTNPAIPEEAIAFEESTVRQLHADAGLPIESVFHGAWSGRDEYLSGQDVCIARKPG